MTRSSKAVAMSEQDKQDWQDRDEPQAKALTDTPPEPPVPDGMDEACFHQGWLAGKERAKETGMIINNPFVEGTHQSDAWLAGFAAFAPPPPEVPGAGF